MVKSKKEIREDVAFSFDFTASLDEAERLTKTPCQEVKARLDTSIALHSGSLMLDLVVLGGGYYPGREYDNVGAEQAGKTTWGTMAIANAIINIPNYCKGAYFDLEGTLDPKWFINILRVQANGRDLDFDVKSYDNIFGKRNDEGKGWDIKPRFRLYKPSSGEKALKLMNQYLSSLPDKICMQGIWYYSWEPVDAKTAKTMGGMTDKVIREMFSSLGISWDAKILKSNGIYAIPVPNNYAGPEGLIFVDSWAAAVPEQTVNDDSNALAQQARMFAKYLPGIKTLIGKKGVILIGVNQNRLNPGVRFGSPEYNPGGESLKHICDCRNRMGALSAGASGATEKDGNDVYKHFSVINRKNKITIPNTSFKGRWWVSRNGKGGCGLDIVQDTLDYLLITHQITSNRRGFIFSIDGNNKFTDWINGKHITYNEFKTLIVDRVFQGKKIDLRKRCIDQIKSGKGQDLYYKHNDISTLPEEDVEDDE